MRARGWLLVLCLTGLLACFTALAGTAAQNRAAAPASYGFDLLDLDMACKPCDDFFQFATGGWRKRNPVGPAYASWSRFSQLHEKNQEALRQILETAAHSQNAPGSIEQKLGDFYASCMDEKRIEADGLKPLEPDLARIAAISSLAELQQEVAGLHSRGVRALFGFTSTQDDKNSEQMIGQATQGGLGLPDRDYYTKQDDRSQQLRQQYEQHVFKMLRLAGDAPAVAAAAARTVLAIETKLAEASKTRVERRDPQANYHKMGPAELRALTPGFSWESYFRHVGFPEIREVNIGQPEFFHALHQQLNAVPLADWKIYLRWHLLRASAPALSSKFVNENFYFFGRRLTGARELQPRWRRCVSSTDRNLGEALGQKYVAGAFPPEAKAKAQAMVADLVAALRSDIETLPWMSDVTRRQAIAKLAAISLKIGYPDKWRDYSAYQVTSGPYIENLRRGDAFEFRRNLAQIGQAVDRGEWQMTPPTVNAYYNSSMNEIVFPAGILQPPFFDPQADDALNYGGMGAVIGHELTHGFDDRGSQYDAQGNLRNWWTPGDLQNFQLRAECIEKQFSSFVVEGDLRQNGKLVLGESIADLGGLNIARMAFERALAARPAPEKIDGYTPMQRFFLAWARIWATNARPEYERMSATVDAHPLPRFRTNGPLSNLPEFAAAFSCQAGAPMARSAEARCKIW